MKKLILITALSICNLSIAMDGNVKIQLGSAQEIKKAVLAKDSRLEPFANNKRILSLSNRVTTPKSLELVVYYVRVQDIKGAYNIIDEQNVTDALISTGKQPSKL